MTSTLPIKLLSLIFEDGVSFSLCLLDVSLKNKLKYIFQKWLLAKPLKIAVKFYCTGSPAMKWTQIWFSSTFMLISSIKPEALREKEFTKWKAIKLLDQFFTLNVTCFFLVFFYLLINDRKHWIDWDVSLHKKHIRLGTQRQIISNRLFQSFFHYQSHDPNREFLSSMWYYSQLFIYTKYLVSDFFLAQPRKYVTAMAYIPSLSF